MGTRKYEAVARKAAADRTRATIIAATRSLLLKGTAAPFSVDAVADKAGVARMTVYHQFGSKRGLLEALFDDIASRGLVERLRASFVHANPSDALDALFDAFAHFWHAERPVIRRLRAMAVADADLEAGVAARDERRREILRRIVDRMGMSGARARDGVDALHMLSSFETYDALAKGRRSLDNVVSTIRTLARAVVN
jgi:AcrR family transcriptional regulator